MTTVFEKPRILVVAGHIGDFVWRSGGAIARYAQEESAIKLIIVSDGLRGEANDYWKTEGANAEEGLKRRRAEGAEAARILGVEEAEFWGLPDYPMTGADGCVEKLAHDIREFRPNLIITHSAFDAFNPDHNTVHQLVQKAHAAATGAGFRDGLEVSPRQTPIFGFEPHVTEISDFKPVVYVDITDVFEIKSRAMKVFSTQPGMYAAYKRKAEARANEASGRGSRPGCKYAEAFSIYHPVAASGGFVW